MPLTNKLKVQLDTPVWEWCRFALVANTAISAMTTAGNGKHRYIFYMVSAALYRYDTWSDGWHQLSSAPVTPVGALAIQYKGFNGYYGRILATATAVTSAVVPHINGKAMVGHKIRIIAGTGVGLERTITDVGLPTIHDSGNASSGSATTVVDTTKAWTTNEHAGRQVRISFGTGSGQIRKILYNNATTLTIGDANWAPFEPHRFGALFTTAPAAGSCYQIESATITLDTSWTVGVDSEFVVLSGSIWACAALAATPFYNLQYYDVLADVWYTKSTHSGFFSAQIGTDWSIDRLGEFAGNYATGTATAGGASTLTDAAKVWTVNRFTNYRVRINSGTGIGQSRTILSNTATVLTTTRPWNTNPDATSVYEILADNDKIFFSGNAQSILAQYSIEIDSWSPSKMYDSGTARNGGARKGLYNEAVPLTSITNSTTTATATTAVNHSFKTGDSITVTGATGADGTLYNITATITVTGLTTFTYTMAGTPTGAAVFTAQSTTVLVDSTKVWTVNEHTNRLVTIHLIGNTAQTRKIISNTANTLTFAAATAPVNATTKYIIHDINAFGHEPGVSAATSGVGTASSGTTTTIVDTTKTWATNVWAGKRVRITGGLGQGQEVVVTSNTATTLTVPTITAPDTTSTYAIYQVAARGAGTHISWAGDNTGVDMQGRYIYSFRGGATNGVDRFDITTERFDFIAMLPQFETLTTGSMYAYDGRNRIYFTKEATGRVYYMDVNTLEIGVAGIIPTTHGAALLGNRMECVTTADELVYLYMMRHSNVEMWRTLCFW